MCQALLITAYCTPLIGPELRAQRPVHAPRVAHFLNELAPFLTAVWQHCHCVDGKGEEFDVFDGHLLCVMCFHLRQIAPSELLDEDGVNDVNASWQDIVADLDLSS